jgi:hypothetical protein
MTSATIIKFPRRRQLGRIIVQRDRDGGFLVIRGSHGWLHGNAWDAFVDAHELAHADAVAVVVRQ